MLIVLAAACEKLRTPCRYLIRDGYVGWVVIEFGVEGADPPREEASQLVFDIPLSGRLAISGEVEDGWARDGYFYVNDEGHVVRELPQTGWGGGGLIWGKSIGSVLEAGRPELKYQSFFVGSEEEFRRAPPVDELERPRDSEYPRR